MVANTVSNYVIAIIEYLRALRLPVVERIQPGLSYAEIDAVARSLDLVMTDELRDLYHAANGTIVRPNVDFLRDLAWFPDGFFMPTLNDAATMYRTFQGDGRWLPAWFPVFANGAGDFTVQVLPEHRAATAQMLDFLLGEGEQPEQYDSLTNMLGFMCECFDSGIYFIDEELGLSWDWAAAWRIGKKWNPTLPYWDLPPSD